MEQISRWSHRRWLCILLVLVMAMPLYTRLNTASALTKEETDRILAFEELQLELSVGAATNQSDIPLPQTLLAEVALTEETISFVRETGPEDDSAYQGHANWVYGSVNETEPAWYGLAENGTVISKIEKIPVVWESDNYDPAAAGEYLFQARFEGYEYAGESPTQLVKVETNVLPPEDAIVEDENEEEATADSEDISGGQETPPVNEEPDLTDHPGIGRLEDPVETIDRAALIQSIIEEADQLPENSDIDVMEEEAVVDVVGISLGNLFVKIEKYEEGATAEELALLETGEVKQRIDRCHELLDYIRYVHLKMPKPGEEVPPKGRQRGLAEATEINIGYGRVYIRDEYSTMYGDRFDGVYQYVGLSDELLSGSPLPLNPNGYKLTGTFRYNVAYGGISSGTIIDVSQTDTRNGVPTAELYFGDLNVTYEYRDGYNTITEIGDAMNIRGKGNVNITLLDGTTNNLIVNAPEMSGSSNTIGGALVKNGTRNDGKLTIRCQQAGEPGHRCSEETCGKLNIEGIGNHVAALGSSQNGARGNNGGFVNLYIEGGIITAKGGAHSPGIGTMCGTVSRVSGGGSKPQADNGEITKNINITGGKVYAYGGTACSGIGSGWGGPVDGIHISGGAYVYAIGGHNSPGIGSGGTVPGGGIGVEAKDGFGVHNIDISGGLTVVEAIGWPGPRGGYTTPGIGAGSRGTGGDGIVTNVQSQPESGWYSIIKQGTSKADAVYTSNTPSPVDVDIETNSYYNLVYFTKEMEKTASVNGGPAETGTESEPIPVSAGDTIVYNLKTFLSVEEPTLAFDVIDKIPPGMTLVTSEGSFKEGMTYETVGDITTVKWSNLTGEQELFFTVTVDEIPGETVIDYINQAERFELDFNASTYSNRTYHQGKAKLDAELQVKKVISNYTDELADHTFFVNIEGEASAKMSLKHDETSKKIIWPCDGTSIVKVSEIVPMEYKEDYKITVSYTSANGDTGTRTPDANGEFEVEPGDKILVTVENTFVHSGYFKDRWHKPNLFLPEEE